MSILENLLSSNLSSALNKHFSEAQREKIMKLMEDNECLRTVFERQFDTSTMSKNMYGDFQYNNIDDVFENSSQTEREIIRFVASSVDISDYIDTELVDCTPERIIFNIEQMLVKSFMDVSVDMLYRMSGFGRIESGTYDCISALWTILCREEGIYDDSSIKLLGVEGMVKRSTEEDYIDKLKHCIFHDQKPAKKEEKKEPQKTSIPILGKEEMEMRELGMKLDDWYKDYYYIMGKESMQEQLNALFNLQEKVRQCKYLGQAKDIEQIVICKREENIPMNFEVFSQMGQLGQGLEGKWEDKASSKIIKNSTVAQLGLILFWGCLQEEIRHLKERLSYDKPHPAMQKITEVEPEQSEDQMPHFGMDDSKEGQKHWKKVYGQLVNKEWIRKREVECGDWVYICCGKGTAPAEQIVWHGPTNALAEIVREYFGGKWDIAHKLFCLKDRKPLPKSFRNTNIPCRGVREFIQEAFRK